VQTTFVHAVQALQHGVVPECESAWLYTIAKNVCHSVRRSNGQRLLHAVDVELDTLSAPEPDPELVERLKAALASLPERQRKALVLREWRGLSSSEVAGRLGMRTSETYALLTRARQSMASALAATTGRTTVAVNLWSILAKLRAVLFGSAAKAAATATVSVGLAVGGIVAVEGATSGPAQPLPGAGPVSSTPTGARAGTSAVASPTGDPQVQRSRSGVSFAARRYGSARTASATPTPPASGETDAGTRPVTSVPTPAAAPPPGPAGTTADSTSARPVPQSGVAGRRLPVPRVARSAVAKTAPPVDLPVDLPADAALPAEATAVVDAVDDALEPLTGVPQPQPSADPPPSSPPAPPQLLP
jgi:RNA polymerase sigma factor (sigma-70 family)